MHALLFIIEYDLYMVLQPANIWLSITESICGATGISAEGKFISHRLLMQITECLLTK